MSGGYAIKMDGDRVVATRAVDSPEPVSEDFPYGLAADEVFWPLENGVPPDPTESPAQIEAAAFALLESKQRPANAQITALQGRVDAINDAIELNEALPEEIAELPVRLAQLVLWKKYRIALGRVITIVGWYQTPTWPVMPEPYTSEMAATSPAASAAA